MLTTRRLVFLLARIPTWIVRFRRRGVVAAVRSKSFGVFWIDSVASLVMSMLLGRTSTSANGVISVVPVVMV